MPDPYECFVRESEVSSSQEYILQRIPGWDGKGEPVLSPSLTPLPLSRLYGASSTSSSDDEDTAGERAQAFDVQRPIEFASPDAQACLEDSYNPAFESDRERSLSPHAEGNVLCNLWGSRLITQSQDVVGGMSHLAQLDMHEVGTIMRKSNVPVDRAKEHVPFKTQNNFFTEQSNCLVYSSKEQRVLHQQRVGDKPVQAIVTEHATFDEMERHFRKASAQSVMRPKEHDDAYFKKKAHSTDMLVSGNELCSRGKPMQIDHLTHIGSVADQAFQKRSGSVSSIHGHPVHFSLLNSKEPQVAAGRVVSSHDDEVRKKSTEKEGEHVLGLSVHKKRFSEKADYVQQNKKSKDDTNEHEAKVLKGCMTRVSDGRRGTTGSIGRECGFPVEILTEDHASISRATSIMDTESRRQFANCAAFPKSLMDAVIGDSGELSTPHDDDLDFLSVFMSTGLSLPLPFRDCRGRLIQAPRFDRT